MWADVMWQEWLLRTRSPLLSCLDGVEGGATRLHWRCTSGHVSGGWRGLRWALSGRRRRWRHFMVSDRKRVNEFRATRVRVHVNTHRSHMGSIYIRYIHHGFSGTVIFRFYQWNKANMFPRVWRVWTVSKITQELLDGLRFYYFWKMIHGSWWKQQRHLQGTDFYECAIRCRCK